MKLLFNIHAEKEDRHRFHFFLVFFISYFCVASRLAVFKCWLQRIFMLNKLFSFDYDENMSLSRSLVLSSLMLHVSSVIPPRFISVENWKLNPSFTNYILINSANKLIVFITYKRTHTHTCIYTDSVRNLILAWDNYYKQNSQLFYVCIQSHHHHHI